MVLTGIEYALTGGRFVTGTGFMSDGYRDLGIGVPDPWTGFTSPVWIAAALAIVLWIVLAKTEVGRYMYAIGGNPEAARLSGIRVRRLRAAGFVITALCAGVGAVVTTARTASSIPNTGATLLLPAFAAAFSARRCPAQPVQRRRHGGRRAVPAGRAERPHVHGLRAGRAEHRPGHHPRRGDADQPPRRGAAVTAWLAAA